MSISWRVCGCGLCGWHWAINVNVFIKYSNKTQLYKQTIIIITYLIAKINDAHINYNKINIQISHNK